MAGNFRIATRLIEHQRYLADAARVSAYQRALAAQVRPTDVVLDLGCGSGILGLLALRAGARHVYAVDEGPVLQLARQLARDNGYADKITHIRGRSTDISLPEAADLLVADQMAPFGLGAGLLRCLDDAAERLLKADARCLPRALSLHIAPAHVPNAHEKIHTFAAGVASFNLSAGLAIMQNMGQNLAIAAAALFSPPQQVANLPLPHRPTGVARAQLHFIMTRAGRVHGLMGCFRAQLADSIFIHNDPYEGGGIDRDQLFLPTPVWEVAPGDPLHAELIIQYDAQVVSWRLWPDGQRKPPLRSTFAGMLVDGTGGARH